MMSYVEKQRKLWVGHKVKFAGAWYTVVDVDHNGGILIDLADEYKNDTAVCYSDIEEIE